jgi:hypothetical protein
VGDVGEHKLGEVGGVHVVGEVLAEAGKGEVGEQVLGGVSTEGMFLNLEEHQLQ